MTLLMTRRAQHYRLAIAPAAVLDRWIMMHMSLIVRCRNAFSTGQALHFFSTVRTSHLPPFANALSAFAAFFSARVKSPTLRPPFETTLTSLRAFDAKPPTSGMAPTMAALMFIGVVSAENKRYVARLDPLRSADAISPRLAL
ncbi:MAG: hypothetical protein ACYC0F_12670 [Rhodanobacter sp.]